MPTPRTFVIAEAGVNHNGDIELAHDLINAAAGAGADAVKFQTFRAEQLAARGAPKAEYQRRTTGEAESQYEMLRRLELDEQAHLRLRDHCRNRRIEFLSSAFDPDSLDLLVTRIGVARLKLGSGEITNGPLLLQAARSGKPIILSTGMSTIEEVEAALSVLAAGYGGAEVPTPKMATQLSTEVTLLHCTTEYPTPPEDINLRAMETLASAFGLPVGLSDHSVGIVVPIAAVARGAVMIEKHLTLDRSLPGPDHAASLEPGELNAMIEGIRTVEAALGSPAKQPAESERKNIPIARKSLVAARAISAGQALGSADIAIKRPGNGMSPMRYWEILGTTAQRDYQPEEPLQE